MSWCSMTKPASFPRSPLHGSSLHPVSWCFLFSLFSLQGKCPLPSPLLTLPPSLHWMGSSAHCATSSSCRREMCLSHCASWAWLILSQHWSIPGMYLGESLSAGVSLLESMQKNAQQLCLRGCVHLPGHITVFHHFGTGAGRALWGQHVQLKPQHGLPGCEWPCARSLAGAKCTSVLPLLPRPRSPSSGEEPLGCPRFSTRGGCSSSAASGLCSPAVGTRCYGLSTTTAVPRGCPVPSPSYFPSNHIPAIPLNHWCQAGAGQQWWQSLFFLTRLMVSHPASAMVLLLLPTMQRSFPLFTLS